MYGCLLASVDSRFTARRALLRAALNADFNCRFGGDDTTCEARQDGESFSPTASCEEVFPSYGNQTKRKIT